MKLQEKVKVCCLALFGNRRRRYEAQHKLLSGIAIILGFRLYNRHMAWLQDEEYKKAWDRFPDRADYVHERKFIMYYIARSICTVSGDMVECGVFFGGTSHLMLCATEGTDKCLYGFDSFEGLSEPSEFDCPANKRTFRWQKHDLSTPEDVAVRNLAQHEDRSSLFKGWIPERFHEVEDKNFSLVHLDVDLYEPTFAALEFFYPRTNLGGIIVCDDYGSEACPGARAAMDEIATENNNTVIHLTTGQGVLIKR